MANNFKVTNKVAKTMTEFLNQRSPILNTANRDYVREFSTAGGYAPGRSINAKIPKSQIVSRGLTDTVKGITDKIVPINVLETDMHNVTEELDVIEELLDIVGGGKALQNPNMKALVDSYGVTTFIGLNGDLEKKAAEDLLATACITPIDDPADLRPLNKYSDISQVRTLMNDLKYSGMRYGMMNTTDSQHVGDSLQNMFNEAINKKITETALVGGTGRGRLAGFDMYESAELVPHEPVAAVEALTNLQVAAVAADGSAITFKNLPNGLTPAFKKGDLVSIPSVTRLDDPTKTPRKWKLVVKAAADANSDGSGNATVTLSDPLIATGQTANVSAIPAANAPAKVFPKHNVNYFYVPSGITAVPLPIKDIRGAENSDITYAKNDIPVKCVVQGNILNFQNAFRTSILCPFKSFADYVVVLPSAVS